MPTCDRVEIIVARLFGRQVTDIGPKTHLADDLRGDSLDFWELVMECEKEFEIEVDEDDVDDGRVATVGDLANVIDRKIAARVTQ